MKMFIVVFALMSGTLLYAQDGFTPFPGQMYGEANQGKPAHHSRQTLTVNVPRGMIVDTRAGGGNIHCCGGVENHNPDSTSVPTGIAVSVGGGDAGEWGVFNIARETVVDDITGEITAYKLSADIYCGPSATGGGCNVHLTGAIKLKSK